MPNWAVSLAASRQMSSARGVRGTSAATGRASDEGG